MGHVSPQCYRREHGLSGPRCLVLEEHNLGCLVSDDHALIEIVKQLLVAFTEHFCLHKDHADFGHNQMHECDCNAEVKHVKHS